MSIYHSIVCALPRLNCPPTKNEWVPSREQIDQLLSPISEEQKVILEFLDKLLDGNTSLEQWKVFQTTHQSQIGYEKLLEFMQTLFSSFELARSCNLERCTNLNTEDLLEQIQDPYILSNIKRNQGKEYSGLQHKFSWIIKYKKHIEQFEYHLADGLLVSEIWKLCDLYIQRDTDLTSVLAMFTQWVLCAQRRPATTTDLISYLQKQLDNQDLIAPWTNSQPREAQV